MINVSGAYIRRAASLIGFPSGTGELVNQPTRRRLLVSLLGSVILSGLDMLGVVAMLPLLQFVAGNSRDSGALGFVSEFLGNPSDQVLVSSLAGAVVICFVGKDVFAVFFRRWQWRFMAHQEVGVSVMMLRHYLTGPYTWHLAKNTGHKVWTVNTAVSIGYSGVLAAALGAVTEILTTTFILVSLAVYAPLTTAGAVVYFALGAFIIQRFLRPRVLESSRLNRDATQRISESSLQALSSGKEVKLGNASELFVGEYEQARRQSADAYARANFLAEVPKYVLEILFVLGLGLLAFSASVQGSRSDTLVLLGIFAAAGSRVLPSAARLLTATNAMRFAREPLEHLIRERRQLDVARNHEFSRVVTDKIPKGDIVISGVEFSYPSRPDQLVLKGVDVTLPAGRSIALVGASGAGKSTLVDLLLGLLGPTAGTITAGGIEIHDNLPGWQRQLAVVPQDVVLFDSSLRANIVFEMPVHPKKLSEVVAKAQLTDLVEELPEGLDSLVGERGGNLSGGQRQRIGVARALYRRPDLLVLDEATSALDNETERRLTETVQSLHGEITMVIVAHRLSTVRHCDQVLFMSDGRVASQGSFDEVVATNQEFAHLVRLGNLQGLE